MASFTTLRPILFAPNFCQSNPSGLNNPRQSVKAKGISFLAEWQVNDLLTVKNILASRDDESWSPIDFDSLPAVDLDVPVNYENDQFSEELQFLFSADRWRGIAGFYYLDANAYNAFDVILGQLGGVIGLPGLNAFTLGDVDTLPIRAELVIDFRVQRSVFLNSSSTFFCILQ